MSEYKLSKKAKLILKLRKSFRIDDVTVATQEQLDDYNRSEIKDRYRFHFLYRPVTKNVYSKTLIIPVSDGAITGYLFEKIGPDAATGLNSLIVFFHDGGWMLGNMEECNALCSNICNVTGCSVLSVDYRLAPAYKFPIPAEDCYSALVWASQGARYWKVDPSKIYLMGTCVGGNLAVAVSRLSRDRKGPKIAGQILLAPVTDGRLRTESYEKYKDSPTLTDKEMAFFIQNYMREPKDILDPLFSPLLAVDHSRLPQTLVITAEQDPLYDDGELFVKALQSADVPAKFLKGCGTIHSMYNYPRSEGWEDQMYAIADFVHGRALSSIEIRTRRQRNRDQSQLIIQ